MQKVEGSSPFIRSDFKPFAAHRPRARASQVPQTPRPRTIGPVWYAKRLAVEVAVLAGAALHAVGSARVRASGRGDGAEVPDMPAATVLTTEERERYRRWWLEESGLAMRVSEIAVGLSG